MRIFFPSTKRTQINTCLRNSFTGALQQAGSIIVQESEGKLYPYRGSSIDQVNLGIVQLWMFLGRNFTLFGLDKAKVEAGEPLVPHRTYDFAWKAFAKLSYQLGFESPIVHHWKSITVPYSEELECNRYFKYTTTSRVSGSVVDSDESITRRYGRPFQASLLSYQPTFFLRNLLGPPLSTMITPCSVRISSFKAFLHSFVEYPNSDYNLTAPLSWEITPLMEELETPTQIIEVLRREKQNLRDRLDRIERQMVDITADNNDKLQQFEAQSHRVYTLQNELLQVTENLSSLQQQNLDLNTQKLDLEINLSQKADVARLQSQLNGCKQENIDLTIRLEKMAQDLSIAEVERTQYITQLENFESNSRIIEQLKTETQIKDIELQRQYKNTTKLSQELAVLQDSSIASIKELDLRDRTIKEIEILKDGELKKLSIRTEQYRIQIKELGEEKDKLYLQNKASIEIIERLRKSVHGLENEAFKRIGTTKYTNQGVQTTSTSSNFPVFDRYLEEALYIEDEAKKLELLQALDKQLQPYFQAQDDSITQDLKVKYWNLLQRSQVSCILIALIPILISCF